MNIKSVAVALIFCCSCILLSFTPIDRTKSIEGTWIRTGDNLMVSIDNGKATILKEGDEKFPCDVSDLLIYKDIQKVKDNLWKCNFLVVTMGTCQTNYESGEIFINRDDQLVIICPGFESKIYAKVKPRYKSDRD